MFLVCPAATTASLFKQVISAENVLIITHLCQNSLQDKLTDLLTLLMKKPEIRFSRRSDTKMVYLIKKKKSKQFCGSKAVVCSPLVVLGLPLEVHYGI